MGVKKRLNPRPIQPPVKPAPPPTVYKVQATYTPRSTSINGPWTPQPPGPGNPLP